MDEFELIDRYFSRPSADEAVAIGVGDDGAVLTPATGYQLVSVVDTLVEAVHFPRSLDPGDVGFRAVAVNVSDIAAMGAEPRWMLLSLTLADAEAAWIAGFADGLFEAAEQFSIALVGGDTTSGTQRVIGIHLLGEVREGQAITRSGAVAGDDIWVSGTLGDAAAGLRLGDSRRFDDDKDFLLRRFRRPEPRLALARRLSGTASAAIDVSDGLYADLAKLLQSSGVGARLELDAIPHSSALCAAFPDTAQELSLAGGDDYELCFTAPARLRDRVADIAVDAGTPVTRIGAVTDEMGVVCRSQDRLVPYDDPGFRHFGGR